MFQQLNFINILRFTIKSFFVVALLLCFFTLGIMYTNNYENITFQLLSWYGKLDKLEEFRNGFFTVTSFNYIKYVFTALLILLSGITFKLDSISKIISTKILSLIHSLKIALRFFSNQYHSLSKNEKISFYALLLLIASTKLYFLPRYFFHIDEITSYLYFIKRGFLVSASYYPNPNNHVLYSLFTICLRPFIQNPFYLMKGGAFIISMITSASLFFLLRRYFSFTTACLSTLIFSFFGQIFNYSLFGRGYLLMTFFVILATFSAFEMLSGKRGEHLWHVYVLSSILGFYTMVIYFYPFATLALVLFSSIIVLSENKKSNLYRFIYYHTLIGIGTLLLYAPVIAISGLSSLTANSWIIKLSFFEFIKELPSYINEAFSHIIDIDYKDTFIGTTIIGLSIFVLIKTKKWSYLLLIGAFYCIPILILMIQHIRPYNRIWTYLIFPTTLCIAFILEYTYNKLNSNKTLKQILTTAIICIVVSYTYFKAYQITSPEKTLAYSIVGRITESVIQKSEGNIYTDDNTFNLYLRYYADQYNKTVLPDMQLQWKEKIYEYILITPELGFPNQLKKNNYSLLEKNKFIEVYKIKNL